MLVESDQTKKIGVFYSTILLSCCSTIPKPPAKSPSMKPRFLFLAFLCFTGLFYACISQSVTAAFPSNTVKSFTGTLDGKPVHVFLNSADSTIHGWYSFDDSNSIVIRLKSDCKLTNDPAFTLTEDKESSQQDSIESKTENIPVWKCTYQEGKVTGTKSYTTSHGLQKAPIILTEAYPAGTYPFTLKSFSHTYDAFPGKDSTPQWSIDYSYPVCTQSGANADWINRQVKLTLNKNPDLSFDTIIHQLVQTGLKDYRTQMQDMEEDSTIAAMGFRPSMDYTTSLGINVTYTQADYLVLSTEIYDYSGGAHGNYATT